MRFDEVWNEPLVERTVTYHIEVAGRLILVENVPARVNIETGETYYSPETVERLQRVVWEQSGGAVAASSLASPKPSHSHD